MESLGRDRQVRARTQAARQDRNEDSEVEQVPSARAACLMAKYSSGLRGELLFWKDCVEAAWNPGFDCGAEPIRL